MILFPFCTNVSIRTNVNNYTNCRETK